MSGLFIPLHAVCNWPSADQLSIDVFGHDRFELFFAPRQPRHNRADWYLESFGNLFVRKLAQVKELHWGSVLNVDSQKSIEDDSRIQGSPGLRFPCRRIVNIGYKLRFEVLFPAANCAQELPTECRKQPTFDMREVANLMRVLGQFEKGLLHQVRGVRFAPYQGNSKPE